ncbi:S-adenosyl-L-methionine-dependent methyltransferase [Kalaharituber pfeilii]|nr:S-adenosyl-L-methionine-dependent methyltransferase [Kalaharituber pfeilii]
MAQSLKSKLSPLKRSEVLEADPDVAYDDTYKDQPPVDTTSVTETLYQHIYENGRTYHRYQAGKYFMPNDEKEMDRLDLQYHMLNLMYGGRIYFAPLENPRKMLDLGTGTGIWAIDMADKFPNAEVIGNDLSPIQPTWVPPNCRFEIDDIEQEWTHQKASFDYIHARYLFGSIENWPALIDQIKIHLTPGGYVEFQETDPSGPCSDDSTVPPDSLLSQFCAQMVHASLIARRPANIARHLKSMLEVAGFEDVHEKVFKLPTSHWSRDRMMKEIGWYNYVNCVDGGLEAAVLALWTRYLGWKKEEVTEFVKRVKEEMKKGGMHSYWKSYVVYGRKPAKKQKDDKEDDRRENTATASGICMHGQEGGGYGITPPTGSP